jgi:hypothetical protein
MALVHGTRRTRPSINTIICIITSKRNTYNGAGSIQLNDHQTFIHFSSSIVTYPSMPKFGRVQSSNVNSLDCLTSVFIVSIESANFLVTAGKGMKINISLSLKQNQPKCITLSVYSSKVALNKRNRVSA